MNNLVIILVHGKTLGETCLRVFIVVMHHARIFEEPVFVVTSTGQTPKPISIVEKNTSYCVNIIILKELFAIFIEYFIELASFQVYFFIRGTKETSRRSG